MTVRREGDTGRRNSRGERGRRHRRDPDSGSTLIEIVITVVLMGTVMVAIMSAVVAAIGASSTARSAARVETAIVNAADRVNRAPKKCDYSIYAKAAVQIEGWDPSQATVTQEYFIPGPTAADAGTWATGNPNTPGCSADEPTDLLVQRVTINLTSPDGKVTRSIEVVKSDV